MNALNRQKPHHSQNLTANCFSQKVPGLWTTLY